MKISKSNTDLDIDPSGFIIKLYYKSLRGVLLLSLIILMDLNSLNYLAPFKSGYGIDPKRKLHVYMESWKGNFNLGSI